MFLTFEGETILVDGDVEYEEGGPAAGMIRFLSVA